MKNEQEENGWRKGECRKTYYNIPGNMMRT
jgi:hypothetical protein